MWAIDRREARWVDLRRKHADLIAAVRAALLARADGEADPWWYLLDELPPAPLGHLLGPAPHGGPDAPGPQDEEDPDTTDSRDPDSRDPQGGEDR